VVGSYVPLGKRLMVGSYVQICAFQVESWLYSVICPSGRG
jgi:hypothetical protein